MNDEEFIYSTDQSMLNEKKERRHTELYQQILDDCSKSKHEDPDVQYICDMIKQTIHMSDHSEWAHMISPTDENISSIIIASVILGTQWSSLNNSSSVMFANKSRGNLNSGRLNKSECNSPEEIEERDSQWQQWADEYHALNPKLSKTKIAKKIADRPGQSCSVGYIRQRIKIEHQA